MFSHTPVSLFSDYSGQLQNVLLMGTFPDCDVKLCDLEISRVIVAGQEVRELLGTPDYVCMSSSFRSCQLIYCLYNLWISLQLYRFSFSVHLHLLATRSLYQRLKFYITSLSTCRRIFGKYFANTFL